MTITMLDKKYKTPDDNFDSFIESGKDKNFSDQLPNSFFRPTLKTRLSSSQKERGQDLFQTQVYKSRTSFQGLERVKASNFYQTASFLQSYFNLTPQKRVELKYRYARKIQTIEDVLITLSLGNDPKFKEGYDGAIALLAECSEKVLTQTINLFRSNLIFQKEVNEENLEILLKSVACASKITSEKKFSLIISLFVKNLGSLTKLTLIDSLTILSDDLDFDLIEVCLERFASNKETDDYVRNCAKEAIEDLQ
jgi:hypothetical protein